MRRVIERCLVVVLTTGAFLGADIAFAVGTEEAVRVPVGAITQDEHLGKVIVVEGDHLWKISRRHLEALAQRIPANSEISPYWLEVIERNVDDLRSGDPDLIYPGEMIEMPRTELSEQP